MPPARAKILYLSLIVQWPCPIIDRLSVFYETLSFLLSAMFCGLQRCQKCIGLLRKIELSWAVLWASNIPKMHLRPGLRPGPHWGSSRRSPSPRPPSRLVRETPYPNAPHPLQRLRRFDILAPSALRSSWLPCKPGAPAD